jgi:hypothetical protein
VTIEEETEEMIRLVGTMILNLPITSKLLGHTSSVSTIRGNYLAFSGAESRVERLAKEYVNDLFKLSTDEMCAKWFDESTTSLRPR